MTLEKQATHVARRQRILTPDAWFKVGDGGQVVGVLKADGCGMRSSASRQVGGWHPPARRTTADRLGVGNVKIEMKGSASAVTKQAAGRAKIDPVVALLNAAKLTAANPMPVRKPDYQMMIFG